MWPDLLAGLTSGTLLVFNAISIGGLVFSGAPQFIPVGIGVALMGGALLNLVSPRFRAYPSITSNLPGGTAAVQATMVASLAALAGQGGQLLPTLLAAVAASALLTGLVLYGLGRLRLAGLIRFIPYPVVGGFLAGTGWLLVQGAFGVVAHLPLDFDNVAALGAVPALRQWVPALFLGVGLIALVRSSHILLLPVGLLAATGIFYLVLRLTGTSVAIAVDAGWLFPPFPEGSSLWQPIGTAELGLVRWDLLPGQLGNVAALVAIALISLVLNVTSLELAIRDEIDLNREMRATSFGNLVAGVLNGGIVGLPPAALSVMDGVGGRSAGVGVVAALLCLATLAAGPLLIPWFPVPIQGSVLFFLGVSFLVDWVHGGWKRMSRIDYGLMMLILAAIAVRGIIAGLVLGITVAALLFVVNYSRVSIVKFGLSGANYMSNVERDAEQRRFLVAHGDQTFILRLQGFIFFGTANELLERIRAKLAGPAPVAVRFLVLDFLFVDGIDSSAVLNFWKIEQLAERTGARIAYANAGVRIRDVMAQGGLVEAGDQMRFFPELELALEWCEERLLRDAPEELGRPMSSDALFAQIVPAGSSGSALADYVERITLAEGEVLCRAGTPATELYFVLSGQLSAWLDLGPDKRKRLLKMGPGTVIGEMGMYLDQSRGADVIAEGESELYRLTAGGMRRMEAEDPDVAAAFHKYIVRLLADRLTRMTKTVGVLVR